ncbi:MAG: thiamine phosphate synthase, partial [Xanthobacteraceae bacterium]
MPRPLDLRLNAIVDPEQAGGRDLADLARLCAEGGATLIQLRDKVDETRAMVAAARAIKAALAPFGVPFVVNDRVDVALAAGADGVHLGPDDMAVEDARAILGQAAIIGASIKSVEAADGLPAELVDYVGSGGVYATLSKQQKGAPIGPQGLARIIAALHKRVPNLPVAGIAGIDASNAAAVV